MNWQIFYKTTGGFHWKKEHYRFKTTSVQAKLIAFPMEEEYGIPYGYFDRICSVYAIGWTVDFARKARMFPVTFVIKARKISSTFPLPVMQWKEPCSRSI